MIAANDGPFKQALDRYKYPERYALDPLVHRASGLAFLRELESLLRAGNHLGGRDRGLSDAAIVPFVRQFAAVDPAWFDAQPLPHLLAWLDHYLKSDLFQSVMLPVAIWSPEDHSLRSASIGDSREARIAG